MTECWRLVKASRKVNETEWGSAGDGQKRHASPSRLFQIPMNYAAASCLVSNPRIRHRKLLQAARNLHLERLNGSDIINPRFIVVS